MHAENGVSLEVRQGEVLGLLGESGSGKRVTMRALMRLLPKKRTRITGSIEVDGRDVLAMKDDELSAMRGKVVSMIFQEPALAPDPVYTIGDQIVEAMQAHIQIDKKAAWAHAETLFKAVGIDMARLSAYPHEMSGGMRQCAMIALALACKPKILLADEPTTALDATVQIQILLLLRELQAEMGMSVIFVTHAYGFGREHHRSICERPQNHIIERAGQLKRARSSDITYILQTGWHLDWQARARLFLIPMSQCVVLKRLWGGPNHRSIP